MFSPGVDRFGASVGTKNRKSRSLRCELHNSEGDKVPIPLDGGRSTQFPDCNDPTLAG